MPAMRAHVQYDKEEPTMTQLGQEDVYVNEQDLEEYIQKKTGIELDVIQKVLDAEFEYLKEKGLVELPEEE